MKHSTYTALRRLLIIPVLIIISCAVIMRARVSAGAAGDPLTTAQAACPAGFGTATNFAAGSNPFSLVKGDFNGDGKLDVAVTNFSSANVSLFLGTGNGTLGAATNFAVGGAPTGMASGDFNGDGKLDLAA